MFCAGIDAGSRAIKVVVLNPDTLEIVAAAARPQGVEQERLAMELLEQVLAEQKLPQSELGMIIATGYGRKLISAAGGAVTEITCQARGVRRLVPDARTIIDIGGQDCKLLRLDAQGAVEDFVMNDRCAAGSGHFLEVLSAKLGVALPELGRLAGQSLAPAVISSMCVVFAESEIVGLLAGGAAPEDLAAGVLHSLATRIGAMGGRDLTPPIVFTGGVALVPGMDRALSEALGRPVATAPRPQLTGALGAAVIAAQRLKGAGTAGPGQI